MKSRHGVVLMVLPLVATSIVLSACGSGGDATTASEGNPTSESAATEKRIEKIEEETKEAELEAALAKKEAAQEAARAKRAAARQAAAAKTESSQTSEASEESVAEPPNVIGMRLPEAESALRAAGFRTQAENTDTAFGIVIRSHYTICSQSEPHGNVVTVLAQKYGC